MQPQIVGNRTYVEIPGAKAHELPPLLVRGTPAVPMDEMMGMAADVVESENMMPGTWAPEGVLEQRKFELALNLSEQYLKFVGAWRWGDSVLEWIRQCEITFESEANLRNLLRPDLWPHAGRSSFVTLLEDKAIPTGDVELESAVGLRLTFRQPPPLSCFSDQFLFYLNRSVAGSAYRSWAATESPAFLPPERFHFYVVKMAA